jgi:predicted enzyme related to lactoylglutathione lyase
MTDPLDALREPVVPVTPDQEFAERLRARLQAALLAREGRTMKTTTKPDGDVGHVSLWLPEPDRAERFYGAVLGWRFGPPPEGHGPVVTSTTLSIGTAPAERPTAFTAHAVENVHETVVRVRAAGGTAEDPQERPYGLTSYCVDDQGMPFAVYQAVVPPELRNEPGEVVYLTVEVPDTARYRAFYGAVFGWTFTPGRINDGYGVNGPRPMTGMHRGTGEPTILPMYLVTDIAAAVGRVRDAGGTATEPAQRPYGLESECGDDQGSRFYLGPF